MYSHSLAFSRLLNALKLMLNPSRYISTIRPTPNSRSLSASVVDPGEEDFLYSWSCDLCLVPNDSSEASPEFTFPVDGTYTIGLTVDDQDGGTDVATVHVEVSNVAPTISAITYDPLFEGTSEEFTVEFSDPGSDETYSASWDFGDGSLVSTGITTSHTYDAPGDYWIFVTVSDGTEASEVFPLQVHVDNVDPTVTYDATQSFLEGDSSSFSLSPEDPGAIDTFTYEWFLDGESLSSAPEPTIDFDQDGSHILSFVVLDGEGGSVSGSIDITVENVKPTFDLGDVPLLLDEGQGHTFTTLVDEPGIIDRQSLVYTWSFSDGEVLYGPAVTKSFANQGDYTVTLTVADDDPGLPNHDVLEITVSNVAPQFGVMADVTGDEGEEITIDLDVSDPGADPLTFTWYMGDGTSFVVEENTSIVYSYSDNGAYTISVTVEDDVGDSDQTSFAATIANVNPVVDIGDYPSIDEGGSISFSSTVNDVGTDDTFTYSWSFGQDEGTSSESNPSHTYLDDGGYTVTLTVTDDDGGIGSDTTTVTVDNVLPTVNLGDDISIDEWTWHEFTSTITDPSPGDIESYLWDFDGLGTSEIPKPQFRFDDDGVHTISLTVKDDSGTPITDTMVVTVNNVAPAFDLPQELEVYQRMGFQFDVSVIDTPADDLDFSAIMGDGETITGTILDGEFTIEHTYSISGPVTIEVTVNDDDGGSTSHTIDIDVIQTEPTFDDISIPEEILEGEEALLSFDIVDVPNEDVDYTIDFGNGKTESGTVTLDQDGRRRIYTGSIYTNNLPDDAQYVILVTATDSDELTGSMVIPLDVFNVAPSLTVSHYGLINPVEVYLIEGMGTHFNIDVWDTMMVDDLTATISYGDGTVVEYNQLATDPPSTPLSIQEVHTWEQGGNYLMVVTADDNDGGITIHEIEVHVNDRPPVVDVGGPAVIPETTGLTRTIHFDDGEEDTFILDINYGDGTGVTGIEVQSDQYGFTHTFPDNGDYTIVIDVLDSDGFPVQETIDVSVLPELPSIDSMSTTPTSIDEGEVVTFTIGVSDIPSDEITITFFPDDHGAPVEISIQGGGTIEIPYLYEEDGEYLPTVIVSDEDHLDEFGGFASYVEESFEPVTVHNVDPVVTVDAVSPIMEGGSVAFEGTVFDQGILDGYTYVWHFGDGKMQGDSLSPTHTYQYDDMFTACLVAEDDDGGVGDACITVTVENVLPTISSMSLSNGMMTVNEAEEDDQLYLTFSFEDPGVLDTYTVTIDKGDGSPLIERGYGELIGQVTGEHSDTIPLTFKTSGEHTITLSVEDEQGIPVEATYDVTISNPPPVAILTLSGVLEGELIIEDPQSTYHVGDDIVFSIVGITDDPLTSYIWDVDVTDGPATPHSISAYPSEETISASFAEAGLHLVTVLVVNGAVGRMLQKEITIHPNDPLADEDGSIDTLEQVFVMEETDGTWEYTYLPQGDHEPLLARVFIDGNGYDLESRTDGFEVWYSLQMTEEELGPGFHVARFQIVTGPEGNPYILPQSCDMFQLIPEFDGYPCQQRGDIVLHTLPMVDWETDFAEAQLIGGYIDRYAGEVDDIYTFYVTYVDPADEEPSSITVDITSIGEVTMEPMPDQVSDYRSGVLYYAEVSPGSPGTYGYSFGGQYPGFGGDIPLTGFDMGPGTFVVLAEEDPEVQRSISASFGPETVDELHQVSFLATLHGFPVPYEGLVEVIMESGAIRLPMVLDTDDLDPLDGQDHLLTTSLPEGTYDYAIRTVSNGVVYRYPSVGYLGGPVVIPPNYPPVLSDPSVTPPGGDEFKSFDFSVVYLDAEGIYPVDPELHIIEDGSEVTIPLTPTSIEPDDPSDTRFSLHTEDRVFVPGVYDYFFTVSDGFNEVRLPADDSFFQLTVVQNTPGYLVDGRVIPGSGDYLDDYVYEVTYFDDDDDLPFSIEVIIDEELQGNIMLPEAPGLPSEGILYRYGPVTLTEGIHSYHFQLQDAHYHQDRLPVQGDLIGPEVSPFIGPDRETIYFIGVLPETSGPEIALIDPAVPFTSVERVAPEHSVSSGSDLRANDGMDVSLDGTRLDFVGVKDGSPGLYVIDRRFHDDPQMVQYPNSVAAATISDDGVYLAYTGYIGADLFQRKT